LCSFYNSARITTLHWMYCVVLGSQCRYNMKGVDKSAFNVVSYIMKRCMHYNTLRPHHNFGKKMAMIWVLRCERVINERSHTPSEIKSRWLRAINSRLIDDKIIATKIRRGRTPLKIVESTWTKVLQKCGPIPQDWIHNREVLVGRRVRTP
jgi:hypothetical protein